MKRIIYILIPLFVLITNNGAAQTKDLDKFTERKRNEYLKKETTKEIIRHFPNRNLENHYIKIECQQVAENTVINEDMGTYPKRVFYTVKYFKDKKKPDDYYAIAYVWEDTGRCYKIQFRSGISVIIKQPKE